MKLTAQVVPWSSVVGTGVVLLDETGRAVGQLALINVALVEIGDARKALMIDMAQTVADAINRP